MVEGENQPLQAVLWSPHATNSVVYTRTQMLKKHLGAGEMEPWLAHCS